ncbi:serine peptidase, partial [Halomonas sp. ND22Bw]
LTQPAVPAYAQSLSKNPIETPDHPPGSFASVVDKVKPGVVAVKVKLDDSADSDDDGDGPGQQQVPPQLREFFKRFGQGGPG